MIENQSIGQIGTVILCALVCLIIKYRSLSTVKLSQPGTALTQFVCFGGGSFFYPVLAIFCLLPASFLIVSGWFFLPCNVWIWGDKRDKCTLLSQVHTCFLSWTLRFRKKLHHPGMHVLCPVVVNFPRIESCFPFAQALFVPQLSCFSNVDTSQKWKPFFFKTSDSA